MDYEETLLQVTDVLKAHNRYHMKVPDHEQAVKAIRDIVTPKGEWIELTKNLTWHYECSECHARPLMARLTNKDVLSTFCPNCGAQMER